MEDSSTRDIAVEAKSMINQHMTDCKQFRESVKETLGEFRDDIKKLNWRMGMLLGALTLLGKVWDIIAPHVH